MITRRCAWLFGSLDNVVDRPTIVRSVDVESHPATRTCCGGTARALPIGGVPSHQTSFHHLAAELLHRRFSFVIARCGIELGTHLLVSRWVYMHGCALDQAGP
jgi:hypothetical protein